MIVLSLNSGSSSLKFGLHRVEGARVVKLVTGASERGVLLAVDADGQALVDTHFDAASPDAAIDAIVSLIEGARLPVPEAIGHRIVHGGRKVRSHCLIDAGVERDLEAAVAMSPLHGPAELRLIRRAREAWHQRPQIACLDTAFHADMPEIARVLPIARELQDEGIQRYGFHGLSCQSIVHQFGSKIPARLIVAHLGSGSSITAVRNGKSMDTSMGLTPAGGVIMGSRSGDIDPGVLVYLLREKGFDAAKLEELVDRSSGMQGISGLSGDLRELHKVAAHSPAARLAIEMFCMSVAKAIAGMIVTLGGVDCVVFTGGIGENDPVIRGGICDRLAFFGFRATREIAASGEHQISPQGSLPALFVMPANENEQIALCASAVACRPT